MCCKINRSCRQFTRILRVESKKINNLIDGLQSAAIDLSLQMVAMDDASEAKLPLKTVSISNGRATPPVIIVEYINFNNNRPSWSATIQKTLRRLLTISAVYHCRLVEESTLFAKKL